VWRPISYANIWASAIHSEEKSGHHPWEDLAKSCYKSIYDEVQIHLAKKLIQKKKKINLLNIS
jgi:hypothetical protein